MKMMLKDWAKKNKYELYIAGLALATFLSYIGWIDSIIMPLFIIIAIAIILLRQDIFYVISLGIFLEMSFSGMRNDVEASIMYLILFTVLIVFDIIYNRKITKVGRFFDPLIALVIVSVFTLFNSPTGFIWIAGIFQIGIVLLLYIYFVNTTKNDDEDYLHKAAIMLIYGAVVVSLQIIHYLVSSDVDTLLLITTRGITIGWENINVIIYINLMALPLLANIIVKAKYKAYYIFLGLLISVGIVLTLSRSSVLVLGIFGLYVIVYAIIKTEKKVNLLYHSLGVLGVILISWVILEQSGLVSGTFDAFFKRDFLAYESRADLLEVAWAEFKSHFMLGTGGLYSSRYYLEEFGAKNYHNTIAQASTLGVFGLAAFGWLLKEKYDMFKENKNSWTLTLVVLIIVTAFINGWVQPMYFYTTYMIYLFLLLAVYENMPSKTKKK